ncbi:MAG: hypothetical protein IPL15_01715 [Comamonadaceae bacterium]|jgi:toxin CptA|uniref:hypothetical protein n=2 Tax=Candidatus Skiveiella danica TaxID=3386177 RepID=UPI001B58C418|nr:hypothetical protein [Comamonadaceae bacterium]MBP7966118.1 hypothetical protein [Burkholderiaceae bacterium]MBK6926364.1 hypothetical protein [Comamonadaceae bacterium]MBK7118488.1 hypothetical protein [Comamonadaceae bacterium]MBK7508161.1 hypothetical protein [Comamonadaceae bacterium]
MPGAPSVRFPVGRSHFLARLLLLVWLAGFLALAWAWPQPGWRWGLAAAVLLLGAAGGAQFWIRMPMGALSWDGRVWRSPNAQELDGAPIVRLDCQRWMLVQLQGADHAGDWLWLEAATDRLHWADLRRALYARPVVPDPQPSELIHE